MDGGNEGCVEPTQSSSSSGISFKIQAKKRAIRTGTEANKEEKDYLVSVEEKELQRYKYPV